MLLADRILFFRGTAGWGCALAQLEGPDGDAAASVACTLAQGETYRILGLSVKSYDFQDGPKMAQDSFKMVKTAQKSSQKFC